MSFEAIEQEISGWDASELRRLQALVATLRRHQEDPGFFKRMDELIEDRDPDRWVTLEQFERKLGLSSASPD